jgi:hypothetical protein
MPNHLHGILTIEGNLVGVTQPRYRVTASSPVADFFHQPHNLGGSLLRLTPNNTFNQHEDLEKEVAYPVVNHCQRQAAQRSGGESKEQATYQQNVNTLGQQATNIGQ